MQHHGDTSVGRNNTLCYRPGVDVVIPPLDGVPQWQRPTAAAVAATSWRPTSILYAFKPTGSGTGVHWGRQPRVEMLDDIRARPLPGALVAVGDVPATVQRMLRSVFCAAPPGYQTWTNRFFMAVACGCIPVTVIRGTDMPWQRRLGLNYSQFSLNLKARRGWL